MRYFDRSLRRFAQYRFIRFETSRRSSGPICFRPRRFTAAGPVEVYDIIKSSNRAIACSTLSFISRNSFMV